MRSQTKACVSAISILAISNPLPSQGELIHRYSFSDPAGDATGASLTDSVGAADGTVLGAGALFTGTGLDLPGGSSDTAAYGDLPNNLISPHTAVTIEGWVTIDAGGNNWGRIFDFGSTEHDGSGGEITGPGNTNGGGTAGLDYLILTASRGENYDQQRVEIRNEDPGGGGINTFDSAVTTTFGSQIHFAVTWEDSGLGTSRINYWRDGVQLNTNSVVTSNLADLNDVNTWLGRSTWLNDGNLDATFDEFRIYDEALTGSQIEASLTAGPDTVVDLSDDPDNDGIPTIYENLYDFLDPNDPNDAGLDEDSDMLTNLEEFQNGTTPDDDDSDDDDLKDGDEIKTHSTNPLNADSDSDGANDGIEINGLNSDPNIADSDSDGINDGPEAKEGLLPLDPTATSPSMIHRYSFDNLAGAVNPGARVIDLIGGADGTVVGSGGNWTGGALALPGGDGATADAAYVDLPNGLLSPLDHTTFEVWYTLRSAQNWGRLWDFGSSEGGEITATMTGATQGLDYYICSASLGTNIGSQRHTIRNLDILAPGGGTGPVDGDEEAFDFANTTNLDQEYHLVGVWTSDLNGRGQLTVYRDGVKQGSRTTTFTPRDINDVNNWLGRSNWTGDSYLHGDYNEFRIYSGAMNDAAVADSFAAGPDVGPGGGAPKITDITYNKNDDTFTLTFTSVPGRFYYVYSSTDLIDFSNEVEDLQSKGLETTAGPFTNPAPGSSQIFYRVSE